MFIVYLYMAWKENLRKMPNYRAKISTPTPQLHTEVPCKEQEKRETIWDITWLSQG